MKEHPILFKGRLVRAIMEGRKTQTRRVGPGAARWLKARKGDRLWVRETFAFFTPPSRMGEPTDADTHYKASATTEDLRWLESEGVRWRPSIHMPRSESRILLELTEDPRVEPLHAMTEADARAEGVEVQAAGYLGAVGYWYESALGAFSSLWNSINGPRGYGWADDPDVVVLTFKVVDP